VKVGLTVTCLLFSVIRTEHIEAGLKPFSGLLGTLAYVGSISYALYVLHVPLIFIVKHLLHQSGPYIQLATFAVLAFSVSHLAERLLQPRLTRALVPTRES